MVHRNATEINGAAKPGENGLQTPTNLDANVLVARNQYAADPAQQDGSGNSALGANANNFGPANGFALAERLAQADAPTPSRTASAN